LPRLPAYGEYLGADSLYQDALPHDVMRQSAGVAGSFSAVTLRLAFSPELSSDPDNGYQDLSITTGPKSSPDTASSHERSCAPANLSWAEPETAQTDPSQQSR
jgi:hypothetical protein